MDRPRYQGGELLVRGSAVAVVDDRKCPDCGTPYATHADGAPRVHFAKPTDTRPCPRSFK